MKFHLSDRFYGEFSEWLAHELKVRGISQMDLCRKSGVSRPHIQRMVSGKSEGMTLVVLCKIASALGYRVDFEFERK
jgi:transcriptional regulator with XRE-family HTH domain